MVSSHTSYTVKAYARAKASINTFMLRQHYKTISKALGSLQALGSQTSLNPSLFYTIYIGKSILLQTKVLTFPVQQNFLL